MTKQQLITLVRSQPNREPYRAVAQAMLTAAEVAELFSLGATGATQPPAPAEGPGTELKKLLESLGVTMPPNCDCNAHMAEMNRNGVAWCQANRAKVMEWLAEGRKQTAWRTQLGAALRGVANGLTGSWSPNPTDPLGSLVDEAIRRAEENPQPG